MKYSLLQHRSTNLLNVFNLNSKSIGSVFRTDNMESGLLYSIGQCDRHQYTITPKLFEMYDMVLEFDSIEDLKERYPEYYV